MTKNELRDKIKTLAKQALIPKSVDLDKGNDVSLNALKFPVLGKFPELKKVIVDLLTQQYEIFLTDIQWVAPRPTTFRIVLANGENFILIYTERSWIAKVEGKKYYLLNLSEEEAAAESIARILSYGLKEENQTPDELSGEEPAEVKPEDIKPEENNPQPEEIPAEA
jgi:hypothetical protein